MPAGPGSKFAKLSAGGLVPTAWLPGKLDARLAADGSSEPESGGISRFLPDLLTPASTGSTEEKLLPDSVVFSEPLADILTTNIQHNFNLKFDFLLKITHNFH